uniref:Putative secreted protein n=1 Tax=Anopheles darlingi TaxID=43151 RepID=A0A2M4D7S7_ANODA
MFVCLLLLLLPTKGSLGTMRSICRLSGSLFCEPLSLAGANKTKPNSQERMGASTTSIRSTTTHPGAATDGTARTKTNIETEIKTNHHGPLAQASPSKKKTKTNEQIKNGLNANERTNERRTLRRVDPGVRHCVKTPLLDTTKQRFSQGRRDDTRLLPSQHHHRGGRGCYGVGKIALIAL